MELLKEINFYKILEFNPTRKTNSFFPIQASNNNILNKQRLPKVQLLTLIVVLFEGLN